MKCQKCNKNEANIQYKESINGKTREICLCSECARESGMLDHTSEIFRNMEREMMSAFTFPFGGQSLLGSPFSSLFGGTPLSLSLLGSENPFADTAEADGFFETDPVEGMETVTTGKDDKAKNAGTINKESKAEKRPETIDELKAQLLDAIGDERYEDAARLRDRINKLKGE